MWRRFGKWLRRFYPEQHTWIAMGRAWQVAGWSVVALVVVTLSAQTAGLYGFLGVLALVCVLLLIATGTWLALLLLSRLPPGARWGLALLAVSLVPVTLFAPRMLGVGYVAVVVLIGLVATGARRSRTGRKTSARIFLAVGSLPLLALLVAFLLSGWPVEDVPGWPSIQAERIDIDNPGQPGSYAVLQRTYGSGSDLHRPEFAADADWQANSVDGSKLLDGWEGPAGWTRSSYWGIDPTRLPVQGRVWLPDGEGPFPLALIVHGNHEMADYSDTGYAYLGELFASHGVITVSVDENFLNSSLADFVAGPEGGLEEESDARAWMLLEHLAQWRAWVADPAHPMSGKADLDRVVLIGHSRGGEAVSEAAVFNRLPRYPDDGTLAFQYNFGIRGIVAIAPVDHQYNPRDRDTPLADVSYLVIHGSHDSDVDTYAGSATYSRLRFDACDACFKSGFYLLGANHGQFNTSWGRYDIGLPAAKLLNVSTLLDPEEQRRVAQVMISAFLEAVLHNREDYRRFLARPERGDHWFPEDVSYLTNYGDARQIHLVSFERDADLESGSEDRISIRAEGFALWKEAQVPLRRRDMDSAAVLLGWDGENPEGQAVYEIEIGDDTFWVTPQMTLSFAAALGTQAPEGVEDFVAPESLDFGIELVDAAGRSAMLRLAALRPLYPQVNPVLYKLDQPSAGKDSEVVFQRYAFPISKWMAANAELDISSLKTVRFVFASSPPASVWLDDVQFSPDGY